MRVFPFAVALATSLAACEPSGDAPSLSADGPDPAAKLPLPFQLTAQQARGRILYDGACWACHGPAGRGDGPARAGSRGRVPDLTSAEYTRLTATELADRMRVDPAGVHRALLAIVNAEGLMSALSYISVLPLPASAPGSALRGRDLYGQYCVSCHGAQGDGRGPASVLLTEKPPNFADNPLIASGDFPAITVVIRDGLQGPHTSSMPAWGLFFDDDMISDVGTYVMTYRTGVVQRQPR